MVHIYTDGACNVDFKTGAWAAFIIIGENVISIKGIEQNTTHNRMELLAAIKAIQKVEELGLDNPQLTVYTDSQYLVKLKERKEKLVKNNFKTKAGKAIRNADLVKEIYAMNEKHNAQFLKVKAHQKKTSEINYNRQADQLARKTLKSTQ